MGLDHVLLVGYGYEKTQLIGNPTYQEIEALNFVQTDTHIIYAPVMYDMLTDNICITLEDLKKCTEIPAKLAEWLPDSGVKRYIVSHVW